MQPSETPRIDELRQELEQHFGKEISSRMRNAFVKFALESFADFEAFEKACELVCANEVTYGRFPTFPRFQELYREWRLTNTGAYEKPKALPGTTDTGYSGPAWDLARLKAKVQVSGHFMDAGLRAEAIEEAALKGIDLAAIGVAAGADFEPMKLEQTPKRGPRSLSDLFSSAVPF